MSVAFAQLSGVCKPRLLGKVKFKMEKVVRGAAGPRKPARRPWRTRYSTARPARTTWAMPSGLSSSQMRASKSSKSA